MKRAMRGLEKSYARLLNTEYPNTEHPNTRTANTQIPNTEH